MSEIILKVNNLGKYFLINNRKYNNIKEYFINIFQKGSKQEQKNKNQKFWALRNISFEAKKGDFISIIGRNGAGKSTLLKLIAGIYHPDEGTVEYSGRIIPFLELGVGFNPNLTGKENVFLNGIIMGLTKKEIESKLEEIFDFADLKGFENLQLKKYSSGMQVRLAFSVAAQTNGDIYLLDEVFAVGDLAFQQKALKKIEEMIAQNKTFIYVGHSMDTVKKYSTNVVYIQNGRLEGVGLEMINKYLKDNK